MDVQITLWMTETVSKGSGNVGEDQRNYYLQLQRKVTNPPRFPPRLQFGALATIENAFETMGNVSN